MYDPSKNTSVYVGRRKNCFERKKGSGTICLPLGIVSTCFYKHMISHQRLHEGTSVRLISTPAIKRLICQCKDDIAIADVLDLLHTRAISAYERREKPEIIIKIIDSTKTL